jgi:hypothetical protein
MRKFLIVIGAWAVSLILGMNASYAGQPSVKEVERETLALSLEAFALEWEHDSAVDYEQLNKLADTVRSGALNTDQKWLLKHYISLRPRSIRPIQIQEMLETASKTGNYNYEFSEIARKRNSSLFSADDLIKTSSVFASFNKESATWFKKMTGGNDKEYPRAGRLNPNTVLESLWLKEDIDATALEKLIARSKTEQDETKREIIKNYLAAISLSVFPPRKLSQIDSMDGTELQELLVNLRSVNQLIAFREKSGGDPIPSDIVYEGIEYFRTQFENDIRLKAISKLLARPKQKPSNETIAALLDSLLTIQKGLDRLAESMKEDPNNRVSVETANIIKDTLDRSQSKANEIRNALSDTEKAAEAR